MAGVKYGTIPLDRLKDEFFVRQRLDDDHVLHLATLYEAGVKLPAVQITRSDAIIDGRHRVAALRMLDRTDVDVEWVDEADRGIILCQALKANTGGSLPPSNSDIVYAISQMLDAGMQNSVVTKHLSPVWPPAVIRRFLSDAASLITQQRIRDAKQAVVEGGLTVADAAAKFKIKTDALKAAITGTKRRKTATSDFKAALTTIFRSRGGKTGAVLRKLTQSYDDGDLSWAQVVDVLEHAEGLVKTANHAVRDWRKRFEAKGKKRAAVEGLTRSGRNANIIT